MAGTRAVSGATAVIVKRVRLHPFGGTVDREYDLAGPVSVVLGPNEAGKSTLRQAIHHALFTPTRQTDKQAEAAIGRWYPRPEGDHVAVTLVFEHDGAEWTLAKRWGADRGSSLHAAGAAAIADADAVQRKLAEILGHNEATARLVLSTGQAELARTVALLADATKKDAIPPVGDVLAKAAGTAGDVGPERLRAALAAKVQEHFGRWDRQRGRPELDRGRERGVAAPWERGAGRIVKAWYAWQERVEELGGLREAEAQLDAASAALAALETQMAADGDFLAKGGPLRDGLAQRSLLETELRGLRAARDGLSEIMVGWPAAAAGLDAATKRLAELQARKQALLAEQADAGRRAAAETMQAEFTALTASRQEWLEAEEAVRQSFRPPREMVAELERVAEGLKDARNRIEAQRLSYEILAREPLAVRIEEADGPPRVVTVEGTQSGQARSRLRVAAGPLTVTVTSGEEDVAALFAVVARGVDRERQLLADCRAGSLVEVLAQVRQHDELVSAAALRKTALEAQLRGTTYDQWQEKIAALSRLPQSRDPATIARELADVDECIGIENGNLRLHGEKVGLWREKHGTPEKLLQSLVEMQSRIERGEERVAALPVVPEGFVNAEAFLAELSRREAENRDRPGLLKEMATRQQQIRDEVGDRSASEIAEEADIRKRAFERALREGLAYERILEVLEGVVAGRGADPLADFAAKVTASFRRITGGGDDLAFDDHLPTQVTRDTVALPPELLSQGAGAALALALRLALAEAHLGDAPGFVVLDDPLVDLDADRRERAKQLLRRFGEKHQVIFLTCHEPHAAGLGVAGVDGGP
ncbi:MAG: hypothetical protein EBZ59_05505 [Planctomycetia bacterium]|nr:hypothetical protein [Planctomycetia bacterium]